MVRESNLNQLEGIDYLIIDYSRLSIVNPKGNFEKSPDIEINLN